MGIFAGWAAGKDEEAKGSVEGDFVLKGDDIGVEDASDGCRGEDATRNTFVPFGVKEGRFGARKGGGQIKDIRWVGDAEAGGELTAGFKGFDEFVLFSSALPPLVEVVGAADH